MLEQFEALGFINERGGLEMNDRDGMLQALRGFTRGANVLVTVKVHRESRSSAQNRYWHGVVVPLFAEHCGYEFEEAKDALALELIPVEIIDMTTGEVCKVPGHTSALNTKQFNEMIKRSQQLGARMGIYIPDPGEDVTGPKRRTA